MQRPHGRNSPLQARASPALGVVIRDQLDRLVAQVEGLPRRPAPASLGRGREQVVGRVGGLSGLTPVVGEDRGIGRRVARRVLDEPSDDPVALTACGLWQRRVGDLADQRVLEAQLLLAADTRGGAVADEPPALERAQRRNELAVACGRERFERALPEEVTDH